MSNTGNYAEAEYRSMDPHMAWGSVVALGLSLAAFALVAPGRPGPLAVSLLGWATLAVLIVLATVVYLSH